MIELKNQENKTVETYLSEEEKVTARQLTEPS